MKISILQLIHKLHQGARASIAGCRLIRPATVLLTMTASTVAGADNVNSSPTLPGVVGPNEILNMGTSLVLIIVAIVVVGWLYSRAQGMRIRNGEFISVLATQTLGPKERVLLVEVAGKRVSSVIITRI